ncbi:hypothetical protein O0544_18530 [Edwardsiella anguillarum]|nr:hypothetical protein [Edwardsiella anguillarum]
MCCLHPGRPHPTAAGQRIMLKTLIGAAAIAILALTAWSLSAPPTALETGWRYLSQEAGTTRAGWGSLPPKSASGRLSPGAISRTTPSPTPGWSTARTTIR